MEAQLMVAIPSAAGGILATIAAAREAGQEPRLGLGVNISESYGMQARECPRYLWLALRWPVSAERFSAGTLRIFELGSLEEARVVADLRRAGVVVEDVDPATGRQRKVYLARGWLRGALDGVIRSGLPEAPAAEHVLEVKTAKASDWRSISTKSVAVAKPEHAAQAQLYMHATGISRALYVVVNKDTDELYAERLHYNAVQCEAIEAAVLQALDESTPAPPLDEGAFACRFCRFRALCHESAPALANCRTCAHGALTRDGGLDCSRWARAVSPDAQKAGCGAHLYDPAFVAGDVVDVDEAANTIEYLLRDGTRWVDGGGEATPPEVGE